MARPVQIMHGETVWYHDDKGNLRIMLEHCPSCGHLTQVRKVTNHWQRPALLLGGLFTGLITWAALPAKNYSYKCGDCGYKY